MPLVLGIAELVGLLAPIVPEGSDVGGPRISHISSRRSLTTALRTGNCLQILLAERGGDALERVLIAVWDIVQKIHRRVGGTSKVLGRTARHIGRKSRPRTASVQSGSKSGRITELGRVLDKAWSAHGRVGLSGKAYGRIRVFILT